VNRFEQTKLPVTYHTMSSQQDINDKFNRADVNHDGTIDEQEFRQFLGPVIRDERRLSGTLTPQDADAIVSLFFIFNCFYLLYLNNRCLVSCQCK